MQALKPVVMTQYTFDLNELFVDVVHQILEVVSHYVVVRDYTSS